jgi:hypothetical protein
VKKIRGSKMKNFEYGRELIRSFKEIFNRPVLLLPFVYVFLLNVLFLIIAPQAPVQLPNGSIDVALLMWVLGLALIQGIISLAFSGMGLASYRMHTNGEDVTCKKQLDQGLHMYWKLLLLRIYQVMIIAIPLVLLFAIYFGVNSVNTIAGTAVGIVLLVGYMVYLITMMFFFLFSNVVIAYEKTAGEALKESHEYFKKNSAHTFFTVIGLIVLGLALFVVMMLVSIPFSIQAQATQAQTTNLNIWYSIVLSFITMPITAVAVLYLFKAFLFNPNENEKKATKIVDIKHSSKSNAGGEAKSMVEKKIAEKKLEQKTPRPNAKSVDAKTKPKKK